MKPILGKIGLWRSSILCSFGVVCLLAVGMSARAQTATLVSVKDNTLFEDSSGTTSNGKGPGMMVGLTGVDTLRRALVAFNFSSIPANSKITSVALTLAMTRTVAGAEDIRLHRVLKNWGEGTSNSGIGPGSGQGTSATTNDATWLHNFYSTSFWTNPGGDFVSTVSATRSVDFVGKYTWES